MATPPAREDDVLWSRTFPGNDSYYSMTIASTADGGYILGGLSMNGTNYRAYTARVDGNGSMLWANNSIPGSYALYDVASLPDGSFVFAGEYGGASTNSSLQGFMVKTDANGRQVFARTCGIIGNLYLSRVLAEDDGSLVALGYGTNWTSGGAIRTYIYLQKTDAAGNVVWTRIYGNGAGANCQGLAKSADGGYVIAGCVFNIDSAFIDAYLLRVDRDGKKLWDAYYPGTGHITIASLSVAGEDGYLLGGKISNQPGMKRYILKVALNGTPLWNRTYDADDAVYDILQATDGGFVMACGRNITKVSNNGDVEWERDFGMGDYALNSVTEAADGSYVFGGWTETSGGNVAQWLVDIGNTKGKGYSPGACCWSAMVLPAIAISVIAIRRRRTG